MRHRIVLSFAIALLAASLFAKEPVKPVKTAVSFTDPAGDATSNDESKPVDIVKIDLTSDGKNLIIAATVTEILEPKGLFEALIAGLSIDTDNNRETGDHGFDGMYGPVPGMEFQSELMAEVNDGNPSHAAAASVISVLKKETIVYASDAEYTKTGGRVYTGKLQYSDLGVKSGQVIRLIARELSDYGETAGMFPEVELKLK